IAPASDAGQRKRRAIAAYTTATTADAATPPIDPAAADAAKPVPCSSARNNDTGPDVNGSPTSQPLIDGPNRRPAIVAIAMSAGVTTSLSARIKWAARPASPARSPRPAAAPP